MIKNNHNLVNLISIINMKLFYINSFTIEYHFHYLYKLIYSLDMIIFIIYIIYC